MKIYKTCREIPIHNFFELSRTGELKYLLKNYDEVEKVKENAEMKKANIDIIDEYNGYFKDKRNESVMKKAELVSLEIKLQNLNVLKYLILMSGVTEAVREMAVKLDADVDNIDVYISATQSQVKKLEKLVAEKTENAENESDNLEKTLSLVKENGFNFDRFSTPVIEFVYAIQRLEEKSAYYEKMSKKR